MSGDEVVGFISVDPPASDALPPPLTQCSRCNYVIDDGVCGVCPPAERPRIERDPLETERYRAELRRVDRMNALRPGQRI